MLLSCSDTSGVCVCVCLNKWEVLPTVHAAGDSSARSSNWAHCGDNVVVVMFGETIYQQALILCQFPQFQGPCTGPSQTQHRLTFKSGKPALWFIIAINLCLTRIWCYNNTLIWHPFHICDSSLSLHSSFAEFLIGGLCRVTVDPNRPLPAPATEAGGTKQQGAICKERQQRQQILKAP